MLLGPVLLKIHFGVDEVVTTLLLNFIVLLLVSLLLEGPLKDPMGLGWPQAEPVTESAELPIFSIGLTILVLLLGEIVPKALGTRLALQIMCLLSGIGKLII